LPPLSGRFLKGAPLLNKNHVGFEKIEAVFEKIEAVFEKKEAVFEKITRRF
jgi:hypothetical protein